jgi:hypothetical protein
VILKPAGERSEPAGSGIGIVRGRHPYIIIVNRIQKPPPVRPDPRAYSDKFNVRLPKSLHALLVSEAEAEGVSA